MKQYVRHVPLALLVLFLHMCSDGPTKVNLEEIDPIVLPEGEPDAAYTTFAYEPIYLSETFEGGSKTAYAIGNVTFGSGSWSLDDALVGTSTTDRKVGTRSVRIRETGRVTMNFNRTAGAGLVRVKHAVFGTDAASNWELWYSTTSGSSWVKAGTTVTSSSTTLQTAVFHINELGNVRIQIRKVSGGANRINIDDVEFSEFRSIHLTMGNPSNATVNTSAPTNYLMKKHQFSLSYHRDQGIPRWVGWHLNTTWLGSTPRQDNFRADTSLPSGWYRVVTSDYTNSGYDRGHMAPSADRTLTVADNSATFLMTNILPQSGNNNRGAWARLEDYCRELANAGNELYIYSGHYGSQGTIAGGKVLVPNRTWKVILVMPNGTHDLSRVNSNTRIIAVDMPNNDSLIPLNANWRNYRVTARSIENNTGLDFFNAVPLTIQNAIETKVDNL